MNDSVRVYAPASVSNVGPGFDLMGFAMEEPGDVLTVRTNTQGNLRIVNNTPSSLPVDPSQNVATVAVKAMLARLESSRGFDLVFERKIKPGSGIGSSAASCTAAVFGVNELLGKPFSPEQLIEFALEGEFLASGSLHADNIAPAMLGGFVLIRSYEPLDIIQLPFPSDLICVVVHPDIEIKTAESRKLIPQNPGIRNTLIQCGNLAGLITGLITTDYALVSRSLHDAIAEPVRAHLIPGYFSLKQDLLDAGAIGANISGSGPSVFALTNRMETARKLSGLMELAFHSQGIACEVYISTISAHGTRSID
jgi:homoserine kinase